MVENSFNSKLYDFKSAKIQVNKFTVDYELEQSLTVEFKTSLYCNSIFTVL